LLFLGCDCSSPLGLRRRLEDERAGILTLQFFITDALFFPYLPFLICLTTRTRRAMFFVLTRSVHLAERRRFY
jgi:hypothetical protein